MKVLIDDKIPYIREAACELFDEVVCLPGRDFAGNEELKDADALIVRTRTVCDRRLLENTAVRFVATATIGFDHINTADLEAMGIGWANCPGCNASSVGQYVRNALYALRDGGRIDDLAVGIVGYGHVGREVCKTLAPEGCRILVNDPPLKEQGGADVELLPLAYLAANCDVVTFHTPLERGGLHPTYHLADRDFFARLRRRPVIINAARGGVVDEAALLEAYDGGAVGEMVIDTWENEPAINGRLLNLAAISTPHIAGYSADGKSNATRMSLRAVCEFFHIPIADEERFLRQTAAPSLSADVSPCGNYVADLLRLYNPLSDSARLKTAPGAFESLRGNYPLRREGF